MVVTPVPAATLIIVRERDGELDVVMVERPRRGSFPGHHVFPGGSVDPDDVHLPIEGSPPDGLATALRETAEEVGLFLTTEGWQALPGGPVAEVLSATGCRLDGTSPVPLARWITPDFMPYRFDTAFFVVSAGTTPELRPAPDEVVWAGWVPVAEALENVASEVWDMVTPTTFHLRWLDQFDSAQAAISSAESRRTQTVLPIIENDSIDEPSWILDDG
ncbi:MAG: NUDIX domain-containing protein [Acidimicrobiia bacterium]|nr:NUDIX domain-containing protein [Acidimicrobiia bacterium]